jgi:carboxypeptidase Q
MRVHHLIRPRSSGTTAHMLALIAGACWLATSAHARTSDASGSTERTASTLRAEAPRQWVAIIDGKDSPVPDIPMGDPAMVEKIIEEGLHRNKVMEHLRYLTQEIGPRLTGSSNAQRANEWTRDQFIAFGVDRAWLDQWGTVATRFDRGPSYARVVIERPVGRADEGRTEFQTVREMEFTTLSWTAGTSGPVRGHVVRMPRTEEEYERIRPQLRGAWVLMQPPPPVGQRGVRQRLTTYFQQRIDARRRVAEGTDPATLPIGQRIIFDGVAGFISTSRDERVWTGGATGWRERVVEDIPPDVHISVRLSDYDYINSRLADGEQFLVEVDLQHTLTPGAIPVYNTIAEIRGSELPDEVVFVTAHLDSWDGPGSQGCTDNATGSAVTLEAARILTAVGAKPKRTIRFILWTGEEQGLLGSRAYVRANQSEHDKWSAMFNDDGGTNTQGGLPAAEVMVPMLAAATAPVNYVFYSQTDQRWLNVNVRNTGPRIRATGSSDHASFIEVGVPGFFWDEVGRADYGYGWHTQHDRFELAIPEYLIQSATCSAVTAYRLANAPTLLPRGEMRAAGTGRPGSGARPDSEPAGPDDATTNPERAPGSPTPAGAGSGQ